MAGVSSYDLRYEIGGAWSRSQLLQPGVPYFFPGNVGGIEFDPLDQFGNGVAVSGSLFDLTFASTGTFSGAQHGEAAEC
jgi:hypothetical protein